MHKLSRLSASALAVVLLLSAFLLPGCGTTDDPSDPSTSPTTTATSTARTTAAGNTDTSAASRKMVDQLLKELDGRLAAQYGTALPDTYAGAYNDTTALVICVTDEAAKETYRAIMNEDAIHDAEIRWLAEIDAEAEDWAGKWADHEWIHYATVEYSLNELQAVKDKLSKNAAEWKIRSMSVDVAKNRLTVELNGDNDDNGNNDAKKAVLAALDERETEMVQILFYFLA